LTAVLTTEAPVKLLHFIRVELTCSSFTQTYPVSDEIIQEIERIYLTWDNFQVF